MQGSTEIFYVLQQDRKVEELSGTCTGDDLEPKICGVIAVCRSNVRGMLCSWEYFWERPRLLLGFLFLLGAASDDEVADVCWASCCMAFIWACNWRIISMASLGIPPVLGTAVEGPGATRPAFVGVVMGGCKPVSGWAALLEFTSWHELAL